jgi:hypothetical protein
MFLERLLQFFLRFWKVQSDYGRIEISHPDLIVPISFATLRDRLCNGTKANADLALQWAKKFSSSQVCFSSCSYPFPGAEQVEDRLRGKIFKDGCVEPIVASSMINTVDEAIRIKDALDERSIYPKVILIIDGEIHSRSAYYVYRKVFPNALVLVYCTPYNLEYQPDQIVESQRTLGSWLFSNIARQIALHVLPLSMIRKIKRKAKG